MGLRIGYVVQDFPPDLGAGPARAGEMTRRWAEAGADVTVVTAVPHRAHSRIDAAYRGRPFVDEEWHGVRVLRSWAYASPRRGFARTLANNVSFMATAALHGALRARRFDVLIASSPPFFVHVAGEAIQRVQRIPMVLEIRDLWPDYLVGMGVLREGRPATRGVFALERHLLRRAAHSVVVTESFRARLAEKGVPRERVDVIPNGVDTASYRPADEAPPFPEMRRADGDFVVGYLGNFGVGQALRTVVEAAARVAPRDARIRFVIAGNGPEREEVEQRARELASGNLSVHPPIPKEQTRAFYNACDVCLVPLAPIAIFQETVPSKIFEVMACERPVLASLAGEGAEIVRRSGGGVVSPPGDADAMAEAILRLRAAPAGERRGMGERGRAYVAAHYERGVLADRYLALLQRVAGRTLPSTGPSGARLTQP